MNKTIAWMLCGLILLAIKGQVQDAVAASGTTPSSQILPIIVMVAASTCFYRALRSALASIVNRGAPTADQGKSGAAKPRPAMWAKPAAAEEAFDADAAFARYMQQREATLGEAPAEPAPPPASPPAQPAFGRRVL